MNKENLLDQTTHFVFGKNWQDYAEKIDDARIAQAISDLQRLCGHKDLQGKTFLDIGCGSGLHALAAVRLGAVRVVGTDIDPDSVAISKTILRRFSPGAHAEFKVYSVFDMNPDEFGVFDIVYSWGVLHHTGDMYRAIACAAALVSPQGQFIVALYKKTPFCGTWRAIKRWYSRSGPTAQRRARGVYVALRRIITRIRGEDFDAYVRDYGKNRGMDFYNDVHDWLGGYPYQSISPDECHASLVGLGFDLKHEFIKTPGRFAPGLCGSGCDEYVFRRLARKQDS
ncbi:MAG: class I SAM-dependent methyltransferase [Gammaproteobacteria bacterium]